MKRFRRTPSPSPSSSGSSSPSDTDHQASAIASPSPAAPQTPLNAPHDIKHARLADHAASAHTCSLPPICSASPLSFPDADALERHYRTMHTFVCEAESIAGRLGGGGDADTRHGAGVELVGYQADAGGVTVRAAQVDGSSAGPASTLGMGPAQLLRCGRVFPDARLLELHQKENHDPLELGRQDAGEPIFECFLPKEACGKVYHTPKKRRNHMVARHHYPKEYFFGVVNYGIGDLVKKYGPGASLLRPAWQPRTPSGHGEQQQQATQVDASTDALRPTHTSLSPPNRSKIASGSFGPPVPPSAASAPRRAPDVEMSDAVNALTSAFASSSLGFVPKAVRVKQKATGGARRGLGSAVSVGSEMDEGRAAVASVHE